MVLIGILLASASNFLFFAHGQQSQQPNLVANAISLDCAKISPQIVTISDHANEAIRTLTVSPQDYGNYVFDHWEDGNTNRTRAVTMTSDTELTAYYLPLATQKISTLTVRTVAIDSNVMLSAPVNIESSGVVVMNSSTSPTTFTGIQGVSYTVIPQNLADHVFDHWEDGSTDPVRLV